MKTSFKVLRKIGRRARIRREVSGTAQRPRLSVFRSHKHLSIQLIDDTKGKVLLCCSSLELPLRQQMPKGGGNIPVAKELGKILANRALEKGLKQVVFDRGGNLYHGRIKALAEAVREGGLQF